MQTPTRSSASAVAADRHAVLRRYGFEPAAEGWQRGPLTFREEQGWLVLTLPGPERADPLRDLGAPGLWKSEGDEQTARRVFGVCGSWITNNDLVPGEEERSTLDAVVEWALATAERTRPHGWTAPERASIDACLDKSRLTLVHRAFTRQLQILHAPDRLALRLPILPALPPGLPAARVRWLRTLLCEAQNAHHLFRLGFAQDGAQESVIAEIDLTGLPPILLEPLLSKSCDALRWGVAWLIESADFITQADVASRALEICAAPKPNP